MSKKQISGIIVAVILAAVSILSALGLLSPEDAEKVNDKVEQVTSD